MSITRFDVGPRMTQVVVHNDTLYFSGQVAEGDSVGEQTRAILGQIDELLARAGSSKAHLLSATIWLADIATFAEMNAVWDEWIADVEAPARATGESRLASAQYLVEIMIVAAKA